MKAQVLGPSGPGQLNQGGNNMSNEKNDDPYDLKEHYPHWEDCEEFYEALKEGAIGSGGEWAFCPFCGDYC